MNAIHRLALSIRAQFEDFVDQVENHQAVAEASLNQFRGNVVSAKFRLRCLEREIQRTQDRITGLGQEAADWKRRALQVEQSDHEKALECVKRMRAASMEADHLVQQKDEMSRIHRDVERDVRNVESQYEDLRRKHKILVSRQSRAEAMKGVAQSSAVEAPHVFERWEARVEKTEIETEIASEVFEAGSTIDSFGEEFRVGEERMALEAILGDLRKE